MWRATQDSWMCCYGCDLCCVEPDVTSLLQLINTVIFLYEIHASMRRMFVATDDFERHRSCDISNKVDTRLPASQYRRRNFFSVRVAHSLVQIFRRQKAVGASRLQTADETAGYDIWRILWQVKGPAAWTTPVNSIIWSPYLNLYLLNIFSWTIWICNSLCNES